MQSRTYDLRSSGRCESVTDEIYSVSCKKDGSVIVKYIYDPVFSYQRSVEDLPEDVGDDYVCSSIEEKRNVREFLTDTYMKRELRGQVLALDDANASFSSHVHNALKLPINAVHTPNPFVCRRLVKRKMSVVYPHTIGQMIRNLPSKHKPFSLIFLDYMCTFRGNSTTSPQKDILLLFEMLKLTQKSLIAITFCTRTRTKKKTAFEDVDEATSFFVESAATKGKTAVLLKSFRYHTIVTLIFGLCH